MKSCAMWEKGPYAICKQRRSKWACAFMLPDLQILCFSTYTMVSIDSVSRQGRPRSACALCAGWSGPALSANCIRALTKCILVYKCQIKVSAWQAYNKTCATSEDSDQPAHTCSLIRTFSDCVSLLHLLAIQREMNKNPCHIGLM